MRDFSQTGETVTPLFQRESRMLDPVILDLLEYWERLRAGRVAPMHSEIDPRAFRGSLDQTFILERTRNDDIQFRLAGNRLCNQMGMDLRGMPAHALIAPAARPFFDTTLREVLAEPIVTELTLETLSADAKTVTARMLLLPLCDDNGAINRVLGCVSSPSAIGFSPNRYTITDIKTMRIVAGQSFQHEDHCREFAEPPSDFEPAPPQPVKTEGPILRPLDGGSTLNRSRQRKSRPNLRLIKDD